MSQRINVRNVLSINCCISDTCIILKAIFIVKIPWVDTTLNWDLNHCCLGAKGRCLLFQRYFFRFINMREKQILNSVIKNPKRQLRVTTHFSKLIKF